jgi:hypothetical protein
LIYLGRVLSQIAKRPEDAYIKIKMMYPLMKGVKGSG